MTIIDNIHNLYISHGNAHYGENVSQLEHALQTAQLAIDDAYDNAFVAACFLHDIGHLHYAEGLATKNIDGEHEEIGANWLAKYFNKDVTEPIRLHVAAKRYICATNPHYFESLSLASKHSLKLQGGPFNEEEIHSFTENPYFEKAVQLRLYDDQGKNTGLDVIELHQIKEILQSVIEAQRNSVLA